MVEGDTKLNSCSASAQRKEVYGFDARSKPRQTLKVVPLLLCQLHDINNVGIWGMPWPKHAQLGLPNKGGAIKGLVV